jgi:CheY-like chemotaxis protein
VQDNLINQQVLAKQLQLADCTSTIAKNGLEALQLLSVSSFSRHAGPNAPTFDICLMDIEMPVMNGVTACHRIRALEKSGDLIHRVPLIAVTANARQEQIEQFISEGFDDVLTKPFRVPDLLKMVDALLKKFVENGWRSTTKPTTNV